MNFASSYVLYEDTPSDNYEVVSDDEFEEGMKLSDSGSDEEEHGSAPPAGKSLLSRIVHNVKSGLGIDEADSAPVPVISQSQCNAPFVCLGKGPILYNAPPPPSRSNRSASKLFKKKTHHWKSEESSEKSRVSAGKNNDRMFRRADTNVVSVRFDTLKTPSTMHAGEAVRCTGCEAILSHISTIKSDGPDKLWCCEFCGNHNVIDIEDEEKPSADDVTFLVEPSLSTSTCGLSGKDESLVIFCVDISGSMCVTSEIPGYLKLRGGSQLRRLRHMNSLSEDQFLPSQRRDVTYISRLQAVQAAVDHQLGEMARNHPDRHIGLVTFNCEVQVIGDGTQEVVTVAGDKLKSIEELTKLGSSLPKPKAIKETRHALGEKVFGLEEGGPTALGPALIVALSMASHHPGSKVILCTDGKANVGLGRVEDPQDGEQEPSEFYETISESASSKGVSISVITIKGTDCKLVHLGKLAERTGGQVNIVDPFKLTEEFSNILANKIIATGVVATFILHHELYIGTEENEANKENREIGNVTADTEISFEYGVRKTKRPHTQQQQTVEPLDKIDEVSSSLEASSLPVTASGAAAQSSKSGSSSSEIPSELPFQLQIIYTDTDGTKALRVLTQKKPVTRDRKVAEEHANLSVIGVHATRLASDLALKGEYSKSRGVALMNQRLAWRSAHSSAPDSVDTKKKVYHTVCSQLKTVENKVQERQKSEREIYGRTHSDDESEEAHGQNDRTVSDGCYNLGHVQTSIKGKRWKKKVRTDEYDDSMAQVMYQARNMSTARFSSESPSDDLKD